MPRMLILPGIATAGGMHDDHGLLDRPSALGYAHGRGYDGKVLEVSGEPAANSNQTKKCLEKIREDGEIAALYGFSGGGYNTFHVLSKLTPDERKRIKLVVVLGTPNRPEAQFKAARFKNGSWELVYRRDPPRSKGGHMAGPKVLLAELDHGTSPTRTA